MTVLQNNNKAKMKAVIQTEMELLFLIRRQYICFTTSFIIL